MRTKNHKRERRIFVQTLFSHSAFKIRVKKMLARKQFGFFRSTSCLDQNHYSNLASKIMKMCEQIFRKRHRSDSF